MFKKNTLRRMLLLLALAAIPGQLLAQSLNDRYTFSSGTDPTLWSPMPATADTLLQPNTPNQTGVGNMWQAEANIGFNFVYGYHSVTYGMENHLYVNDDGMIRMGYHTYFTAHYYDGDPWHTFSWINSPNFVNVINGFGGDGFLDSISYVCTWLDTTQSNKRRIVEFMLADSLQPGKHRNFQVHLEENTYDITIVYANAIPSDYPNRAYMIGVNTGFVSGICANISVTGDSVLWDNTTHTNVSNLWPAANHYYKFSFRHDVMQLPYYQDFDHTTTSTDEFSQVLPNGWYSLAPFGSAITNIPTIWRKVYGTASFLAASQPYCLALLANLSTNAVVLPPFEAPIDSLRLDFELNDTRFNYTDTSITSITYNTDIPRLFVVGIMKPDSLFIPLDSIYNTTESWPEHHTVFFNKYDSLISTCGADARIVLYSPYIPFYVDDVEVQRNDHPISCLPAKSLHVDTLTQHSATISWTTYSDSSHTWWIECGPLGFTPGSGYTEYTETNSITLSTLAEGTPYDFYLWPECGDDTMHIRFTTEASPVMALPYETGFEDGEDQAWHFDNSINGWTIGAAASSSGNKSLYISCDGGMHNRYSNNGGHSFASRTFNINTPGTYTIRYDWRCYGNYMRAAFVPASDTTIVAGVNPYPPFSMEQYTNETEFLPLPAGWRRAGYMINPPYYSPDIMTDARGNLSWTTFEDTLTFSVDDTGLYRLVFFYYCDWEAYSTGSELAAAVDNIWFGIETCPPVKNLEATSLTDNSATITWEAGGSESSWTVSFNGVVVGTTATPVYTFNNLEPGTEYTASVRARCSASDSAGLTNVNFHTLDCTPIAVPYIQNFDSLDTFEEFELPYCWEYKFSNPYFRYIVWGSTNANHPIIQKDSTNAASGLYSLRLNKEALVMLPPFDVMMGNLQLDFDVKPIYDNICYTRLIIGVMEGQRFVPYDTVALGTANNYQHVTLYMGDYTGTGNRIAFLNEWLTDEVATSVLNRIHIDNIAITLAPSCVSPTGLTITNLTHNSVSYYWHGNGGTAWEVEYGPAGFTPGTGIVDTVYTSACTLTGLTPATAYDCFVTPLCSEGTAEAATLFFVTRNQPITTLPYYTGFEPGEDTQWELRNGTNGWYIGAADAYVSDNSLYISADSGSTHNYDATVESYSFAMRDFVVDVAGDYTIGFDWHCAGDLNNIYMRVVLVPSRYSIQDNDHNGLLYNNTPEGWVNVGSAHTVYGNTRQMFAHPIWEHFETTVTIDSTALDTYTLLFFWSNKGYSNGIPNPPPAAVDNVVFGIINCSQPSEIVLDSASGNSLSFHWSDVVNANSYEVWVGNHLIGTTTGTYYTATGLQSTTNYTVAVRGICGAGDTSFFARTVLTTECGVHLLTVDNPLFEDFESPTPPALCWSIVNTSVDNPLTHTTSQAYSGSRSFRFSSWEEDSYDEYDQYLISPQLSCTDSIYISFMGRRVTGSDRVRIGYSTTTPEPSSMTWGSWRTPAANNVWEEIRDTLPPDTKYITIHYYANYMYYFYVDSLTISTNALNCFTPVVTDTATTYRSIDIAWTLSDSTEIVIIEGTTFDETVPAVVSTAGSYSFTGLTPSTTYIIGLRGICDSIHYTDWNIFTVTTDDLECVAPASVTATAGFTSVHISWVPFGSEEAWQVHVFDAAGYDILIPATIAEADLGNLSQGWTYSVQVRPMCGDDNEVEGPWSDTIFFTTNTCEPPTDVTVTAAATTAIVSWAASVNSTGAYNILYGPAEFLAGDGITVSATGTSHTLTDLEPVTDYDVYVNSVCEGDVVSIWTTVYNFTTDSLVGIADVDGANSVSLYPNPTNNKVTLAVKDLSGEATVSIVDMNGREAMHATMSESTLTLDVSRLPKGAYFLRLTGEHMNVIRKLLIL